jgi:ABC-type transporter lipoprotein component MlaA
MVLTTQLTVHYLNVLYLLVVNTVTSFKKNLYDLFIMMDYLMHLKVKNTVITTGGLNPVILSANGENCYSIC